MPSAPDSAVASTVIVSFLFKPLIVYFLMVGLPFGSVGHPVLMSKLFNLYQIVSIIQINDETLRQIKDANQNY